MRPITMRNTMRPPLPSAPRTKRTTPQRLPARFLGTAVLLALASGSVPADTGSSASYRLSGGVVDQHATGALDARGPSYRVQSRHGTAFHGSPGVSTTYRLQSGYLPVAASTPIVLRLDRLVGGVGRLTAFFSATGLPAGTPVTLTCTAAGGGAHSASATTSPISLSGLQDGERYTCTLSALGVVSATLTASAGPQPIPTLSWLGGLLLASLLGASARRGRRH